MFGGTAADSYGIHKGESNEVKTTAPKLSTPDSGNVFICCKQCENESSTKQTGDFEKGSNPIDDSVLERIHPGLTGMHTCTAMGNLFSSVFES